MFFSTQVWQFGLSHGFSQRQLLPPDISLSLLMLARANHGTLKNVSRKRQASLINCTQQVYEAILFHMKDLGEKLERVSIRRK